MGEMRSMILAVFVGTVVTAASHASELDAYRWKSRVLVVTGAIDDANVEAQRHVYQSSFEGMSERDIILVEAVDGSDRSRRIRAQFSADGKMFQVFLVGKDGHTAFSSNAPLTAATLFRKVDAMPMRRDEMRHGH